MRYVDFHVLDNDSLKIELTPEGREYLQESTYEVLLEDILEYQLCNGWTSLLPEAIGALTDSPILSDDVTTDEHGEVTAVGRMFWFPQYETVNPVEQLLEQGYIIFTKGE